MPGVIRRQGRRRGGWGESHLRYLAVGHDVVHVLLGGDPPFGENPDPSELARAWRAMKPAVYAMHEKEEGRFPWPHPEHPWAYYVFEEGSADQYNELSAELRHQSRQACLLGHQSRRPCDRRHCLREQRCKAVPTRFQH